MNTLPIKYSVKFCKQGYVILKFTTLRLTDLEQSYDCRVGGMGEETVGELRMDIITKTSSGWMTFDIPRVQLFELEYL